MTHLCFVLFLVCLYVCVCECLLHHNMRMYTSNQYSYHVRGPLRECRSIRSGASGLPYYRAPLVCVSAVIESLAVWRHNKPKTKNRGSSVATQSLKQRVLEKIPGQLEASFRARGKRRGSKAPPLAARPSSSPSGKKATPTYSPHHAFL